MKKIILTICFILTGIKVMAAVAETDYREIDEAITHSNEYVAEYERKISQARKALEMEKEVNGEYRCAFQLYELYRPFVSDSAMFFLNRCIQLADQQGWTSKSALCRSLLAIRCSSIGMYDEALSILDSIRINGIDTLSLGTYYEAYNNVYSELQYYTRLQEMKTVYEQKAQYYEQLMLQYLPKDSEANFLKREQRAQNSGDLKTSMAINDEWLRNVEKGSHPYALVALYRYIEFKLQGDSTQMMYWLKESVLADIRNAVMDQGSMWELANELMLQGDIDRASRYISFTSDCANRYGSRQRNWQISPLLSHIAKEYKQQSELTTRQLRLLVALISVLALLLLGLLLFLHRRNQQLAAARNALRDSNRELGAANTQLAAQRDELSALNAQLSALNTQLSEKNEQFQLLNSQLADSNHVKEEYIGRFLSLCSQYVDKLDNYRKMVNNKMKKKEFDQLFRISKSTELKEHELDELYENFDTVFLHLFPNFIDDFNALLLPQAQVHPKQENRLTTEIRIFALIRLGIEDSSKIAEFLHYSVNTIYNYRARIKNGAIVNREKFETYVKELGLPGKDIVNA